MIPASRRVSRSRLLGYDVEAIDGSIGKIDDATLETDTEHIVVDTGRNLQQEVMLPVSVLKPSPREREVFVYRTKTIKNTPEFTTRCEHERTAPTPYLLQH